MRTFDFSEAYRDITEILQNRGFRDDTAPVVRAITHLLAAQATLGENHIESHAQLMEMNANLKNLGMYIKTGNEILLRMSKQLEDIKNISILASDIDLDAVEPKEG